MTASLFRDAMPGLLVGDQVDDCRAMSMDIAGAGHVSADVVLKPADQEQVAGLVRLARREGVALHPRGGGLSYTGGYMPQRAPSAIVDSSLLGGIAIQRDAGTVTAGAGVAWGALYDALDASGLRAASFGPLSGVGATVGGSAAQNGGFFGAAGYGAMGDFTVAETVMIDGSGEAVRVADADRTDGFTAPQPLVGDCGAFGIRTEVTLRTIARPEETAFLSLGFEEGEAALRALAAMAGLPCLGEAYVFDPGTHANLARSGFSVLESAELAGDLLTARGGWIKRIGGLLRTARAGKAFVADLAWSLHLSFDGAEADVAAARAEAMRRTAGLGAELIPDVIPRVTRARPFRKIKALLGPQGERWLPCHGVLALADAPAGLIAIQAVLAEQAELMALHGVRVVLLAVLMGSRIVLEPQMFWRDALTPYLRRMVQPEQLAAYGDEPANAPATAMALDLRRRLIAALDAVGAAHFQIGRSYADHPGVTSQAQAAWRRLKQQFDPGGIMNPGVLGLR